MTIIITLPYLTPIHHCSKILIFQGDGCTFTFVFNGETNIQRNQNLHGTFAVKIIFLSFMITFDAQKFYKIDVKQSHQESKM